MKHRAALRTAVTAVGVAALSMTGLAACGTAVSPGASTGAAGPEDLDGAWQLTAGTIQGDALQPLAEAPVNLTIDGAAVSGRAACTSYSGSISADSDHLSVSDVQHTEMACEADVRALETTFLTALESVDAATRSGDVLTMAATGVELIFERADPAPSDSIYGWWLLREGSSNGVRLAIGHERVTLSLDGSRAAARAGCNYLDATVRVEGSTIAMTDWAGTAMNCTKLLELEASYLDALSAVDAYEVTADGLVLSGAGTELSFVALPDVDLSALVDRRWAIESLSKGGVDVPILDVGGYLELTADGSYAGSTGSCAFHGTFVVEGDRLRFTSNGILEDACPYDTGPQANFVFGAHGTEFEPVLGDGTLTITGEGGETVVYREGPLAH